MTLKGLLSLCLAALPMSALAAPADPLADPPPADAAAPVDPLADPPPGAPPTPADDPAPPPAEDPAPPADSGPQTPYTQGRTRVSLGASASGRGSDFGFAAAVGVGVFVFDNFEVGVDTTLFFGGDDPFVAQLGPEIRYMFVPGDTVHPYVGAFYRHWFIAENIADIDSVGARAGVIIRVPPVFFSLGIAYERTISQCTDCDDVYPELGLSLLF